MPSFYENEVKENEPILVSGNNGGLPSSPYIMSRYLTLKPNGDFVVGNPVGDKLYWDGLNLKATGSVISEIMADKIIMQGEPNRLTNNDSGGTTTIDYYDTKFQAESAGRASRYSDLIIDASKDFTIAFVAKFNHSTNQRIFIGLHSDADKILTSSAQVEGHAGINIENATAVYSNADGTTQKTTAIDNGITLTNYNTYKIVKTGSSIKFYVNSILKATHLVNIPTNTLYLLFSIQETAAAGVAKTMNVYNNFVITNAL